MAFTMAPMYFCGSLRARLWLSRLWHFLLLCAVESCSPQFRRCRRPAFSRARGDHLESMEWVFLSGMKAHPRVAESHPCSQFGESGGPRAPPESVSAVTLRFATPSSTCPLGIGQHHHERQTDEQREHSSVRNLSLRCARHGDLLQCSWYYIML
ncbi:hypothetical protein C8Q78DRAFT_579558 [Trametes maxima]|nr:hypothetical protein C8Q78DRAFT_579558 [Trametes maxima]